VEFASLRCRLGALTTRIGGVGELDPMRVRLDRNLGKARHLLDVAGASCDVAKRGPAKRRLRMMRRRLVRVAKTLRKGGAPTITAPIVQTTQALATDTRAFAAVLSCP